MKVAYVEIHREILENKLEEEDRRDGGSRNHTFNLRMTIRKYRQVNASLHTCFTHLLYTPALHTCFIDHSKAFEHVNHQKMWQTLKETNLHTKLIHLIKCFDEGQQSAVQLEGWNIRMVPRNQRVKQGCILSPRIFSLYSPGRGSSLGSETHPAFIYLFIERA